MIFIFGKRGDKDDKADDIAYRDPCTDNTLQEQVTDIYKTYPADFAVKPKSRKTGVRTFNLLLKRGRYDKFEKKVKTWLSVAIMGLSVIFSFCFIWGYINPGIEFEVFYDKTAPKRFDDSLKIIRDTVYADSGMLSKWVVPVKISYSGSPSEKDIGALEKIVDVFNTVYGFPGIEIVSSDWNALLFFSDKNNHETKKSQFGTDDSSVCQLVFSGGEIEKASILFEPGGTQGYRNSVILHECFHLVGFRGHTLYTKSILNYFTPAAGLCGADILAFKMIYNPDIQPAFFYKELTDYYTMPVSEFLSSANR